jgi:hypothetical protein
MTREELFSVFPRPWRLSREEIGVVLAADGTEVLTVDTVHICEDEQAIALAKLIIEWSQEADE